MRPITIAIPCKAPSWNQFWSSGHWSKRKAIKDKWKAMTLEAIGKDYQMIDHPVAVTVYAYARRPLDASNVCIKPMEDALIGKILHDDSPEWVKSLKVHPIKSHDECVVMVLEEVETSELSGPKQVRCG